MKLAITFCIFSVKFGLLQLWVGSVSGSSCFKCRFFRVQVVTSSGHFILPAITITHNSFCNCIMLHIDIAQFLSLLKSLESNATFESCLYYLFSAN